MFVQFLITTFLLPFLQVRSKASEDHVKRVHEDNDTIDLDVIHRFFIMIRGRLFHLIQDFQTTYHFPEDCVFPI